MAWWELDFNYWGIKLLALVGLAKSVKVTHLSATTSRLKQSPLE
jgi:fatty-acid desaturase